MSSNLELTCSEKYKMPIDPANKMAISINYYIPFKFTGKEVYWHSYNTWENKMITKNYFKNLIH